MRTKDGSEEVEIVVQDNGVGIPEDIKDKIFTPFFSRKASSVGTGLGLSISYDIIVKDHQGSISFESKEGEYTVFTVRIPRRK